jgi:hypothetical protein
MCDYKSILVGPTPSAQPPTASGLQGCMIFEGPTDNQQSRGAYDSIRTRDPYA